MRLLKTVQTLTLSTVLVLALSACHQKDRHDTNTTTQTGSAMQEGGASDAFDSVGTNTQPTDPTPDTDTANDHTTQESVGNDTPNSSNASGTNGTDAQSADTTPNGSNASASSGNNNASAGGSSDNGSSGSELNGSAGGNDNNGTGGGSDDDAGTGASDSNTTAGSDDNSSTGSDDNTSTEEDTHTAAITSLVLTADQTKFVRTLDPFYYKYVPVRLPLTVWGTYDDGHRELITDRIQWDIQGGTVRSSLNFLKDPDIANAVRIDKDNAVVATKGSYAITARLGTLRSNTIDINIKDDPAKVQIRPEYEGDEMTLSLMLVRKPTSQVRLTLRLDDDANVTFDGNAKTTIVTIAPSLWVYDDQLGDVPAVNTYVSLHDTDHDRNGTVTVYVDAVRSADLFYDGAKIEPVTLPKNKPPVLHMPKPQSLRGAVRGVRIVFAIPEGYQEDDYGKQTVRLIDPPKGMRIRNDLFFDVRDTVVEWQIPMDAKEGAYYPVTVEATNPYGMKKRLTFAIKVPKTKPIATEVHNNELIVTDPSSPLYGMKLKGHNGEDISTVRLRSVAYEDIPSYKPKAVLERYAFVVYHKPPKVHMDLSKVPHSGFFRFNEIGFFGFGKTWQSIAHTYLVDAKDAWDSATGRYVIKDNMKKTLQHNEYDEGGNKLYLIVKEVR